MEFPTFIEPKWNLDAKYIIPGQIITIPGFFSSAECKQLIDKLEHLSFDAPDSGPPKPGYAVRTNNRLSFQSEEFAHDMFHCTGLAKICSKIDFFSHEPQKQRRCIGLNPNIRAYRYDKHQRFGKHYDDSVEVLGVGQTEYTLLVYLNGNGGIYEDQQEEEEEEDKDKDQEGLGIGKNNNSNNRNGQDDEQKSNMRGKRRKKRKHHNQSSSSTSTPSASSTSSTTLSSSTTSSSSSSTTTTSSSNHDEDTNNDDDDDEDISASLRGGATIFYADPVIVGHQPAMNDSKNNNSTNNNNKKNKKKKKQGKYKSSSSSSSSSSSVGDVEIVRVYPCAGLLLLHRHGDRCMLHEGQRVLKGVKYLLRSDLIFD